MKMPAIACNNETGMDQSIEGYSIVSSESVYFQFPIRALNMGKKIDEVTEDEASDRFQLIVAYCLIEYGKVNFAKTGEDHGYEVAKWYYESKDCRTKCNPDTRQNAEVLFAAQRLVVLLASDGACAKKRHKVIADLSGGNMSVRLRRDLFWDLVSMGWREWSILCAVYAMLGNRSRVRLCYKQINALALGFNSVNQIGKQVLSQLSLTDRQTAYTVDKLARRNLFSKFSINGRHNWYSHKPQRELEEMIIDSETYKQKKERDAKASEATARGRAEVLRRLEAIQRDSAKAELASMKNNPLSVGKV